MLIVYKDIVPGTIVSEIPISDIQNAFGGTVVVTKENDNFDNFSGEEMSAIVLYFNEHYAELITSGLLFPAAYDVLKGMLKKLWHGLNLLIKRKESDDSPKKLIRLHLKNHSRTVEIVFEGYDGEQQLDKIIDNAFAFVRSHEFTEAARNPDFTNTDGDKPGHMIVYDFGKKAWTPVDYGEIKKKFDELRKFAEENFDS